MLILIFVLAVILIAVFTVLVLLVLVSVLVIILVVVLIVHIFKSSCQICSLSAASLVCPSFYDLSFALKIIAAIRPANMAAVIPPDAAFKPPVNIPMKPSLSTASRTPFASKLPKPESGTVAPAPASSANGWYMPIAPKTTHWALKRIVP